MVKADDMSPREAKERLVELQRRTRDRQRQYVEKQRANGQKRVNAFITNEAHKTLKFEQEATGKTIGDILSEALRSYGTLNTAQRSDVTTNTHINQNISIPHPLGEAQQRVLELTKGRFSQRNIAELLKAEGFKNSKGKAGWSSKTIARIQKALRSQGYLE